MNPISAIKQLPIYLSLLLLSGTASADILSEKIKQSEEKRMQSLGYTKLLADIKPFVTDGCSGGLSTGWKYFAEIFPGFATHFGENPPWQQCCIAHDLAYWQGDTADGYETRLSVDRKLKSCVENTGIPVQGKLQTEATLGLKITASMMYQAVRLGGKPCTQLPWRWGYGWPLCVNDITQKTKNEE